MTFNLTTFLGVGVIRDGLPSSSQLSYFLKMVAQGIKLNKVMGGASDKTQLAAEVQVTDLPVSILYQQ